MVVVNQPEWWSHAFYIEFELLSLPNFPRPLKSTTVTVTPLKGLKDYLNFSEASCTFHSKVSSKRGFHNLYESRIYNTVVLLCRRWRNFDESLGSAEWCSCVNLANSRKSCEWVWRQKYAYDEATPGGGPREVRKPLWKSQITAVLPKFEPINYTDRFSRDRNECCFFRLTALLLSQPAEKGCPICWKDADYARTLARKLAAR